MDNGREFVQDYDTTLEIDCQGKAELILWSIHGLVQTSANLYFYLQRWETVFNIMIYKIAGCSELEKLRVLHLFKVDLNLLIGILFGRHAMYHIINNKLYHKGQYRR